MLTITACLLASRIWKEKLLLSYPSSSPFADSLSDVNTLVQIYEGFTMSGHTLLASWCHEKRLNLNLLVRVVHLRRHLENAMRYLDTTTVQETTANDERVIECIKTVFGHQTAQRMPTAGLYTLDRPNERGYKIDSWSVLAAKKPRRIMYLSCDDDETLSWITDLTRYQQLVGHDDDDDAIREV